jgi:PST family polysaccharide transporter
MVYPLQAISHAVARVSFPAFSRAAADLHALSEGFLKMVKGVSLATFPMVAGIFAVAPDFVHVVYGPKWAETAALLRVLCVAGLVQSVGTTVGAVYQSLGRPGLQLRMALLNVAFTAAALAIGARWGLMGIAAAYAAFAVCWVHFSMFVVTRLIGLPFARLYGRLGPSFIASMIMLAMVMAARGAFANASVLSLIVSVVLGAAVQAVALMALGELRWIGRRPVFQLG